MNLIQQIFLNQVTEDGINELKSRYPETFMDGVKMSNDDQFKDARKIKTERNKLIKAINDKRISFTGEVKNYSDSIIDQINEIYDPIVIAFDEENSKRKEIEAEKARKLAVLMDEESRKIQEIKQMIESARNKSSSEVQDIIEAVDLIDTASFHKDLIHEAIETKETVLSDLAGILSSAIASEKVEQERAKLKLESDKLKRGQEIQERIDNLKMIPSKMFGKTGDEMSLKISSIEKFEIKAEDFDELVDVAIALRAEVLTQLKSMRDQVVEMEEFKAHQAIVKAEKEKLEEKSKAKEVAVQVSGIDIKEEEVNNSEPETPATEKSEDTTLTKDSLVSFLSFCSDDEDMIEAFGYLLLSSDKQHNEEALSKIKKGFCNHVA